MHAIVQYLYVLSFTGTQRAVDTSFCRFCRCQDTHSRRRWSLCCLMDIDRRRCWFRRCWNSGSGRSSNNRRFPVRQSYWA